MTTKSIVIVAVTSMAGLVGAVLASFAILDSNTSFDPALDARCNALKVVQQDADLIEQIWTELVLYAASFDGAESAEINKFRYGAAVNISELSMQPKVPWDALGVPYEYATVQIRGSDIAGPGGSGINEIGLGMAARYHLVFKTKIDENGAFIYDEVFVRCNKVDY